MQLFPPLDRVSYFITQFLQGGIVLISSEVSDRLLPKFSRRAEELQQTIKPVDLGSLEQLRELVELVSSGQVNEIERHMAF